MFRNDFFMYTFFRGLNLRKFWLGKDTQTHAFMENGRQIYSRIVEMLLSLSSISARPVKVRGAKANTACIRSSCPRSLVVKPKRHTFIVRAREEDEEEEGVVEEDFEYGTHVIHNHFELGNLQ